jgi:hypothetical protein
MPIESVGSGVHDVWVRTTRRALVWAAIAALGAPVIIGTATVSASGADVTADVFRSSADGRYQELLSPYPHVRDTLTGAQHEPVWAGFSVDPVPGCAVTQMLSVNGSLTTLQTCVTARHRPIVSSYPLVGVGRTREFAPRAVQPRLSRDGTKLVWRASKAAPKRVFDLVRWRFVAAR